MNTQAYNLTNFPENYKIAQCTTVQFEALPSRVQELLDSTWNQDYRINPGHFPALDQFINYRKKTVILKTPIIEANASLKAAEKAKEIVENSLNPLRILNFMDSAVREYYFGTRDNTQTQVGEYMSTVLRGYTAMRYSKENDYATL